MHVVQLLLKPTKQEKLEIAKRFRSLAHIHNVCVKHARKQLVKLRKDSLYQQKQEAVSLLLKKESLSSVERKQLKELYREMASIRLQYGLSKADFERYLKTCGKQFSKQLSSQQVQAEAARVWNSVEKILFSTGNQVHFKKESAFTTIGGKSNLNGARFDLNTMMLSWIGLSLKCYFPKKASSKTYLQESLQHKISYCEIKRQMFPSGWRYYVQIVLADDAPTKINQIGTETMGIDPGVSTVACVSDSTCLLKELAPLSDTYEKEIFHLQQKMDTSRRISNPGKYHPDGSIDTKNKDKWIYSKNYLRMQRNVKSLYRKKAAYIKTSHRTLCNQILKIAGEIVVEHMDFRALQRRAKETKRQQKESVIQKKDGSVKTIHRYQRKKRFGKSLNRRAPAWFLSELKRKTELLCGSYLEIHTKTFKASQYNHVTDTYEKIPLWQRSKQIGAHTVQRDLYSAFLIQNTDNTLAHPDRQKCLQEFDNFIKHQDKCIEQIKALGQSMPQCFGF